jgi:hypothetical protein
MVEATATGRRILTKGRRQHVRTLIDGLTGLTNEELADIGRGAELIERVTRVP